MQIKNATPGTYQDGGGLIFVKTANSARWVYRYTLHGKRRDMGLGPLSDVPLRLARQLRDEWAAVRAAGLDPIVVRKEREQLAGQNDPTFADLAQLAFEAKKPGLKGGGKAGRWMSPLETHVIPKIGRMKVSGITAQHVHDAIAPIWRKQHEVALKALNRTRIVLRHGAYSGMPVDPAIADSAKYMLGQYIRTPVHIEAMDWRDVPDFYARLNDEGTVGAAVQWLIITMVRSAAGRGAKYSEIDGDVWTVPIERMKGLVGRTEPFRVPLTAEHHRIIDMQRPVSEALRSDYLFTARFQGKGITDGGVYRLFERMKVSARPHGFRSSFKTWVAENEVASYDVTETALQHAIGNKVERSYMRSDLLDQRRVLIEKWVAHVTGAEAKVVQLRNR